MGHSGEESVPQSSGVRAKFARNDLVRPKMNIAELPAISAKIALTKNMTAAICITPRQPIATDGDLPRRPDSRSYQDGSHIDAEG